MARVDTSYRTIIRISYPIIAGLVAQNIMLVIDTAFLGRVGEVTLGASAIGGIFFISLLMLGNGFSVGTQILIGRRNGEKQFHQIGRILDHTIYFMIFLAIVLWAIIKWFAPWMLQFFISSEAVLDEALIYLQYRKYGFLFAFLVLSFKAFYVGITQTKILIIGTTVLAAANIFFDYTLIFGNFGFPRMEIAGAALATNLAEIITFGFVLIWTFNISNLKAFRLFKFFTPHLSLYRYIFKLAVPVMFQFFLSFFAFFLFFIVLEKLGETALAASNITRSIYMVLMIPALGLGSATNSLVSNLIGQGEREKVMLLIKKIIFLSLAIMIVLMQVNIFIPVRLASFYTNEVHVIQATIPLLRVTCLALMAFSVSMILFNGLTGTGMTKLALKIEVISMFVYLSVAYILAAWLRVDASVVWLAEAVYFSALGLISFYYLRRGTWKRYFI